MSTRARFESLDLADVTPLRDLAAARASDLPRQQHALMSGWGGPPQARSVYWGSESGVPYEGHISYRVPPGVTEVDVSVLAWGEGTIRFLPSTDAVGTKLRFATLDYTHTLTGQLESAVWLGTAGVLDSDNGAESGRAMTVRAAVAWTWTDVEIQIDLTSTTDAYVYAVTFTPLHIPR